MKKILSLILLCLFILGCSVPVKNNISKQKEQTKEFVPKIEIENTLKYSSASGFYSGNIKGFVVFINKEEQPKNAEQYFIIEPTNQVDEEGNQIFFVEDIVVFEGLSPTSIGKNKFVIKMEAPNVFSLKDEAGNEFFIEKPTYYVSMVDSGGDTIKLITDKIEYIKYYENK